MYYMYTQKYIIHIVMYTEYDDYIIIVIIGIVIAAEGMGRRCNIMMMILQMQYRRTAALCRHRYLANKK